MTDKTVLVATGYSNSGEKNIVIRDDSFNGDITAFRTAIADVTFCYEITEPTITDVTPSSISLQAGNNVAMQTDGGRTLAELAMTYENLPSES